MVGPRYVLKQRVTPNEGGGATITETYGFYGFMKSWFFLIGLGAVWAAYSPVDGLHPIFLLIFAPCWVAGISALYDLFYRRTFRFESNREKILVVTRSLFGKGESKRYLHSEAELKIEGHWALVSPITFYHIVFFSLPGIRFSLNISTDEQEAAKIATDLKKMLGLNSEPNPESLDDAKPSS